MKASVELGEGMVRVSTDVQRRLGSRLRELRLAAGLTQTTLATRAGLSYKFIGEIERGVGNPTVDSLFAVAQALSVSLADCFLISESSDSSEPAVVRTLSEEDYSAIREAVATMKQCLQRARPPSALRAHSTGQAAEGQRADRQG